MEAACKRWYNSRQAVVGGVWVVWGGVGGLLVVGSSGHQWASVGWQWAVGISWVGSGAAGWRASMILYD